MSVSMSVRLRVSKTTRSNFTNFSIYMLTVAVARSSSDDNAVHYFLLVFVDDVILDNNCQYTGDTNRACT